MNPNDTAETVTASARDTGTYLAKYAMDHPIRIAVTMGALTWWLLRDRSREGYYGINDTSWDDDEGIYAGPSRKSLGDRVGDYASSARDTVGEYAASARDTVGSYASSARDAVGAYASNARDTVGGYADSARTSAVRASERARHAANTAYTQTGSWISDNPMAAGVIALAVGAAIGMSIPRSEVEDRTMGETRDQAVQRASQAARHLKDNVSHKVVTAAENFAVDSLFGPPQPRTAPETRM